MLTNGDYLMVDNKEINRRWVEGTKVAYNEGRISKRQLEGVLNAKKNPKPEY